MTAEVAIRVKPATAREGYHDGMPVWVHPQGISWTLAEMNQWINNGTEPASVASMPIHKRQSYRRFRRQANYLANNFEENDAARRWYGLDPGATPTQHQLDAVNGKLASYQEWEAEVIAQGFNDSNWSATELKHFAIFSVDVSAARAMAFISGAIDDTTDDFSRLETVSVRSHLIDWRSLPGVNASIIATIEDDTATLAPSIFRARIYTPAEVLAVTTEINSLSDVPPVP